MILSLPLTGVMKLSCFSAVMLVIGWNQCVKWVAPISHAQSFIFSATTFAMLGSSLAPLIAVFFKDSYTSLGRRSRIFSSLKTALPKISGILFTALPPFTK